tara:strand:- start:74 stop:394 length:321 start_codon:yes stop_codon:yes gene_type:complete
MSEMNKKVTKIIDEQMKEAGLIPKVKNAWNEKVLWEMSADAHEFGEEKWHEEHAKCVAHIAELRIELAKTIWTAKHMAYVAFDIWEKGSSFPKSLTKFKMPETKNT